MFVHEHSWVRFCCGAPSFTVGFSTRVLWCGRCARRDSLLQRASQQTTVARGARIHVPRGRFGVTLENCCISHGKRLYNP